MLQDVWIGWLELDLLLGDVHSLKEKRSFVRPIVAELQRRFAVSAAEVGDQDLHRRATVGVALVAADRQHVVEVLDAAERLWRSDRRPICSAPVADCRPATTDARPSERGRP